MSTIPYYLRPNQDVSSQVFGEIDLFNYDSLENIKFDDSERSLWEQIAEGSGSVGNYVYDAFSGTWTSVANIGDSILDKGFESVDRVFDIIKSNLLFIAGVLVVIIYVGGKSGLWTAVAEVFK